MIRVDGIWKRGLDWYIWWGFDTLLISVLISLDEVGEYLGFG